MTDYADLEKRLRRRASDRRVGVPNVDLRVKPTTTLLTEAADAIASLTKQRDDAQADANVAREECAFLTKQNADMREARHILGRDVGHVAGFLEVTAARHNRGALSAAEYAQRLKDCADMLRNALAGQDISRDEGEGEKP